MIDLDPEIAAAFGNSVNISSKCTSSDKSIEHRSWCRICLDSNQGTRCAYSESGEQAKKNIGTDAG